MTTTTKEKPAATAAPTTEKAIAAATDGRQIMLHEDIDARTGQFAAALPAHIPVERFKRVLLTAISANPDLVKADRRTLFNSAMKAAQDGLLPDGREGALVIYNTKIKDDGKDVWIKAVQWMPMIAGIRKKVRNSGEIATWDAHVIHEHDEFDYQLGLDPRLHHKPKMTGDRGNLIGAYSVARLKSGETSFEVMSADEIWAVWSKASKAKDNGKPAGPWKDYQGEMFRKTVARRHSKVLPMSTDLDDLIRRDDDLYDMEGASDREVKDHRPARPVLQDFSQQPIGAEAEPTPAAEAQEKIQAEDVEPGPADAYAEGEKARAAGKPKFSVPDLWKDDGVMTEAFHAGWDAEDAEMSKDKGKAA